ncbi:VCBS repeat-containing protein, partial [bacterium]|nr:VCBS repeat-containing protein [bacterium]
RPAAAACLLLAWSGAAHATFEERTNDAGILGSGATWGAQTIDIDEDGDLDVLSGTHFNAPFVFTNDGTGSFSLGSPPPLAQNEADRHGFLWVDLDGDGLTDILCSHGGGGGCVSCEVTGNELWRGLGDGLFELIPGAGGMADSTGRGRAFAAADIDGDGDLDLHHSQAPLVSSPNALFRNDGNLNFVDVAAAWGVDEGEGTVTGLFADYDDDGDPDLLVGGEEFGRSTILYRNDGSGFVDVTTAAFGSLPIVAGADWGDFDNDGDLDLVIVEGDEGVFDAWRVEGNDFQFFANHRFGDDGVDAFHMDSPGGSPVASFRWRGAYSPDKVFLGPNAIPQPSPIVLLTNAYVGAPTFTPGVDEGLYCWRESPGGTWQFHVTAPPATFGSYVGIVYTAGGIGSPGDSNLETLTVTPRQPRIYRNDGGTFTELTGLGFTTSANPRAVTWVDFDNDGDLDVHQTNKGTIAIANEQDILWRNDAGSFTALQGASWAPGDTHHLTDGGVWGDLDGDGDLDLYLLEGTGPYFPDNGAAPIYYRNNGPAGNW